MKKEIITRVFELGSLKMLNDIEQKLVRKAQKACDKSYSPYSKFKVGAAVLLENNVIISGNNQENAAFPSGVCAEQVALFYANANFPDEAVKIMVITAKKNTKYTPVSPCGKCRQVLLESEERFQKSIKIILFGEEKIYVIEKAKSLLPFHFSAKDLK